MVLGITNTYYSSHSLRSKSTASSASSLTCPLVHVCIFLLLKQHIYVLSFIFAFFPCFKLKKNPPQKAEKLYKELYREQKLPGQRRISHKETAVFFRVPGCFHIVQHKRALCPTFGLMWSTYPLIPTERGRERGRKTKWGCFCCKRGVACHQRATI